LGIHVKARVGLVENAECGFEHRHLENLVALALTAREALVDRAVHQFLVNPYEFTLLTHDFEEIC
jgi:hypothetical protein